MNYHKELRMTSKFTVPKQPRKKQKFSWWHIVLFTALLLVTLMILFPEKLLISALINNPHPSQLSVIYLRNLVALQPQNSQLKLALAEQELARASGASRKVQGVAHLDVTLRREGGGVVVLSPRAVPALDPG